MYLRENYVNALYWQKSISVLFDEYIIIGKQEYWWCLNYLVNEKYYYTLANCYCTLPFEILFSKHNFTFLTEIVF